MDNIIVLNTIVLRPIDMPNIAQIAVLNLKINESRLFPAFAFTLTQTSPPKLNTMSIHLYYNKYNTFLIGS